MQLASRVRYEQVGAPVLAEIGGCDPHTGVRVVDGLTPRDLVEPEPKLSGPRDVPVQLVRISVVGHVQVEAPVAIEVREHRAEAVTEPLVLEAGDLSHLSERGAVVPGCSSIEVEEVAHRMVVVGEAGSGGGDWPVHIRVARHEKVRQSVVVHVPDRRPGVPAGRVDTGCSGAFRERPVAVVPEERVVSVGRYVVSRRRHVDVGVAVEVEVGGDASAPS